MPLPVARQRSLAKLMEGLAPKDLDGKAVLLSVQARPQRCFGISCFAGSDHLFTGFLVWIVAIGCK